MTAKLRPSAARVKRPIKVLVYGAHNLWFGRVIGFTTKTGKWRKVRSDHPAPEVQKTRPDYACEQAITAYLRSRRFKVKCERCGYEWHRRYKVKHRPPKKCPGCHHPPMLAESTKAQRAKDAQAKAIINDEQQ